MTDHLIIRTEGLSKLYKGVQALRSLDLKVPQNSIFGFLGPNGAGKTTAIKLLLGLARPTNGSGSMFGMDIVKDSMSIRRRIGYLPQEPRFYDYMTARETLRFTAHFFYTGPQHLIEERINEVLALVSLSDKADRSIKGFSGGERQRLGIAQAQLNQPDLLILDEPAAALDPMGRHDVLQIMEKLRAHTTIFYSTHILNDVQRVSDMVAILKQGEIVAQAPVKDLLAGKGIVYTATLKGDIQAAKAMLLAQEWVLSVDMLTSADRSELDIAVADETAAEAQLLALLLADKTISVLEFTRKKSDLEQIFMELMSNG
ncbi:MAG: ABC transporter ATP-binding protein [Anaerolineae bacterium]